MNKKVLSISLLLFTLSTSLFLLGCQNSQIKFNRESAASSLLNKFSTNEKPQVKGHGIIILRDESSSLNNNINFGPRDINFDMPAKFK